ncbi:hypothetical protein GFL58_32865 [Rhizobium leguminosarum bv. viciae]|nr:hypothetical protein [Rhizobium leguminosarum bv. viciae]
MFRPASTTPGHWIEWERLVVQLWSLGGEKDGWMPQGANALGTRNWRKTWPGAHALPGKGDIYHALQACLIPLFPATGSLTRLIVESEARNGAGTSQG